MLLETIAQLDRTLAGASDQADPSETKRLRLALRALARGSGHSVRLLDRDRAVEALLGRFAR